MHLSGRLVATVAFAALCLGAGATDDEEKAACVHAHVEAQEKRRAGELREALETLERCARASCPPIVQRDCVTWAEEVAAQVPSVVVVVRDPDGRELVDADVRVDGKRVALDGRAVELDPGEHRLIVQKRNERAERRLLLREGERMRRVEITLGSRKPPPLKSFEPHPVAWVLTAVASAASAGFVTLAVVGKIRESELDDCAPTCVDDTGAPALDDVREMRQLYLGADISLGVAIAAVLALAGYFAVDTQLSSPAAGRAKGWTIAF